ncbi:TetR family transcriptional regulator [Nonomuraea sp. B5E05]|uniref:TetR family transcriptional regulator n=1 Tax=Nonomuraea sp. B5E05 TaxID=3153569 RepID=UPI00326097C5
MSGFMCFSSTSGAIRSASKATAERSAPQLIESVTMTTRKDRAERNDRALLQPARDVLAEDGAHTPVAAIAARAGVGAGSLYRRYQTPPAGARPPRDPAMGAIDRAEIPPPAGRHQEGRQDIAVGSGRAITRLRSAWASRTLVHDAGACAADRACGRGRRNSRCSRRRAW